MSAAISYLDVYEISQHLGDEAVAPGDLVRTGENLFPHFRVIAVHHDKVWLRNEENGVDGVTALSRCRKINGEPAFG